MKPLIRPFLFAVARLGLFLGMVAWGLAQWIYAGATIPYINQLMATKGGVKLELREHGVRLLMSQSQYPLTPWRVEVLGEKPLHFDPSVPDENRPVFRYEYDHAALVQWIGDESYMIISSGERHEKVYFPGFSVASSSTFKGQLIIVRHWLVVTIFALFYGVLKWVYRTQEMAEEE